MRYILQLNPVETTLLEVADLDELWEEAKQFRPILAVMILQGHLQVETPDLALACFAYVVEFVITFPRQTN